MIWNRKQKLRIIVMRQANTIIFTTKSFFFFYSPIYRSEYFLLCIWLCPVYVRRRWKSRIKKRSWWPYNDYSIKHSYRALKWRGGIGPLTIACQIAQHCLCFFYLHIYGHWKYVYAPRFDAFIINLMFCTMYKVGW